MDRIASPSHLRDELQNVLAYSRRDSPSRAKIASDLRSLANRLAALSWRNTTSTNDGHRKFEAVLGNVELHVDGFEKGPRKGDWTWKCSTLEGRYKESKGSAPSESEAKRRCESAAKKLGA